MRFTLAATFALLGAASAQLSLVVPGGDSLWWVAESANNIVWTCDTSPYGNFTVLIANSNVALLPSPIAVISIENNYDCSKTLTQEQVNQPVGTGYTVQLANIFNETDIYAESQPFEIKALGAIYPAASATPTASGTQTGTAASASVSATSPASGSSKNSGSSTAGKLSMMGAALATVGMAVGLMA
ncbi:hypothetical protein FIBSPDRAFT_879272 [Athelia psychrophila]|uniref:Uncharacterized protein n=1 Tax=Athelia psychrophila TaxID=1759441 RepID=A0A167U6L7_9AGAM|nr:hypothetical protein FIBSPDRAFT_879272 [Fibularhizoctonia sp. CBS 109695]